MSANEGEDQCPPGLHSLVKDEKTECYITGFVTLSDNMSSLSEEIIPEHAIAAPEQISISAMSEQGSANSSLKPEFEEVFKSFSRFESIQNVLRKSNDEIDVLKKELRREIEAYQIQAECCKNQNEKYLTEIERLRRNLKESEENSNKERSEANNNNEQEKFYAEIRHLNNVISQLTISNEALKNEIKALKEVIAKECIDPNDKEMEKSSTDIKKLLMKNEKLKDEIDNLQEVMAKECIDPNNKEMEKLDTEMEKSNTDIIQLEIKNEKLRDEIANLQEVIDWEESIAKKKFIELQTDYAWHKKKKTDKLNIILEENQHLEKEFSNYQSIISPQDYIPPFTTASQDSTNTIASCNNAEKEMITTKIKELKAVNAALTRKVEELTKTIESDPNKTKRNYIELMKEFQETRKNIKRIYEEASQKKRFLMNGCDHYQTLTHTDDCIPSNSLDSDKAESKPKYQRSETLPNRVKIGSTVSEEDDAELVEKQSDDVITKEDNLESVENETLPVNVKDEHNVNIDSENEMKSSSDDSDSMAKLLNDLKKDQEQYTNSD